MPLREFHSRHPNVLHFPFACAFMFFLCFTTASAQSPNIQIEGVVQDQTGAAVERAEVILKNGSAVMAESITDSAGRFRLEVSTTAAATVSVRAEGFASFESRLDAVQTNLLGLEIVLAPAP